MTPYTKIQPLDFSNKQYIKIQLLGNYFGYKKSLGTGFGLKNCCCFIGFRLQKRPILGSSRVEIILKFSNLDFWSGSRLTLVISTVVKFICSYVILKQNYWKKIFI